MQTNDINAIFKNCLDILRSEGLTGEKALRNLSYILILKLMENRFDDDFNNYNYNFKVLDNDKIKILSCIKLNNLVKEPDDNILNMLKNIWNIILSINPLTEKIFYNDKFTEIKRGSALRKLIINLNKIEVKNIDYDILGASYEEVIKDLMTGKVLGQFFTQAIVKNIMIELINPQLKPDGTIESMCDPTMGTAGFLITYIRNIMKQGIDRKIELNWSDIKSNLYGKEIDPDTYQLAISNMLISTGHIFDDIDCGDSLRNPINRKFDIIMANPPFGIKGINYDEFISPIKKQYFPIKTKSAVLLFLQAIIFMLKINGRCTVVLPNGQDLFSKNKSIYQIREYLMKTCDLKEIIYLPSDVFENTSIKTCIFYFVKKKEGTEVITNIDRKKTKEYKFVDTHETKSVKFYDYDIKENKKNLLLNVSIDLISNNSYSLNYADYRIEEKKEYKRNIELKIFSVIFTLLKGNLQSSEVVGDEKGEILFISKSEISDISKKIISECYYNEGLFIANAFNGNGKCPIRFSQNKCIHSNLMSILKPNEEYKNQINIKYIYYYLKSIQEYIEKVYEQGSCNKSLDVNNFNRMQIPIPALEIQTQLVEYLDFLDSCNKTSNIKIEELKKLNSYRLNHQKMYGVNDTKTLSDVCKFLPKSKRQASYGKEEGKYPFFKSSMNINSYVDDPDYKVESIII